MLLSDAMGLESRVSIRYAAPNDLLTNGVKALLKAIADKLIPGIHDDQRIALLQQTEALDGVKPKADGSTAQLSTLQHIIERATAKDVIEGEIKGRITVPVSRFSVHL